jgi:hypothetical protein
LCDRTHWNFCDRHLFSIKAGQDEGTTSKDFVKPLKACNSSSEAFEILGRFVDACPAFSPSHLALYGMHCIADAFPDLSYHGGSYSLTVPRNKALRAAHQALLLSLLSLSSLMPKGAKAVILCSVAG